MNEKEFRHIYSQVYRYALRAIQDWLDAEKNVAAKNAERYSEFIGRIPSGWPKEPIILVRDAHESSAREVVHRMTKQVATLAAAYGDTPNDGKHCPVCNSPNPQTRLAVMSENEGGLCAVSCSSDWHDRTMWNASTASLVADDERADMRARFGSWYQRQDFSARTCEAAFTAGYEAAKGNKP